MDILENWKWMDNRMDRHRRLNPEFVDGVNEFVEFATREDNFLRYPKLRCPCKKCSCKQFHNVDDVMIYLYERGLMDHYYYWTNHGEVRPPDPPIMFPESYYGSSEHRDEFNLFEKMIMDHAGPSVGEAIQQADTIGEDRLEEDPNPAAQRFYDMLKSAQAPLWDGCENYSELSASLVALSLKFDYNMSEGCFNRMVEFMRDALPTGNRMVPNLYHAKKTVASLGLRCIKIDCCKNGHVILE
jgi:hypothetical protein